jgi:sugar (pentulose or hexulose) kinase
MSEKYVIGIDSGTQSTRVIMYDSKGKRVAAGSAEHPKLQNPHKGWFEHGKDDIWNGLRSATADMLAHFSGSVNDIAGIGLSSQRACCLAVDQEGELLYNPISWLDERWHMNIPCLGKIETDIADPLYQGFWPYYSKALWFKFNEKDVYDKAAKYLSVSAYLANKLTGNASLDTISNAFGWPWDVINWTSYQGDAEIELVGMRRDQIAVPVPAGTLIGKLNAGAAKVLGLPEGCPVAIGTGDKQSELLGVGAIKHGQAYITLGTLAGLDLVCSDYKPALDFAYYTYLGAIPKLYNFESSVNKGFWLISWFRDNFGDGLKEEARAAGVSVEAMLDREAETIPAGSEGLVVLPDWWTPAARPNGKGMFIGFDDRHKRGHMYRALVEGLMTQIKIGADRMSERLGMTIDEIYIGGGGSKSNFIAQVIADMFNVPVYRTRESENCSLGAALCGAVGAGIYPDLPSAAAGMASGTDRFSPNKESHELYKALSENVIQKLYPALEEVLKNLIELTANKQ